MKTKVLFVIENHRYGGGERAFAQLMRGLNISEFEVMAACITSLPGSAQFANEAARYGRVESLDLSGLFRPAAVKRLRELAVKSGVHIVNSQGPRADFYARLALLDVPGVKLVSTVAAPVEEYDIGPLRKAAYRFFDGLRRERADRFVAVADHIAAKLRGKGIPAEKIVRIYNGIDAALYQPDPAAAAEARQKAGVPAGAFLAGAFSRLSAEKGLPKFIEAARLFASRAGGADCRFLIAGEGPLQSELRGAARRAGLEKRFVFTGFLPDPRALMNACDLFVLPSSREGLPLGLMEAMALARPVAASAVDGVRELVSDGANGLLFPAGDALSLSRCLQQVHRDRPLAARLGLKAAADMRLRFGIDKMVGGHEALFRELVKI